MSQTKLQISTEYSSSPHTAQRQEQVAFIGYRDLNPELIVITKMEELQLSVSKGQKRKLAETNSAAAADDAAAATTPAVDLGGKKEEEKKDEEKKEEKKEKGAEGG